MKRITLFQGHYGSGKTNIAVNYAEYIKSIYDKVMIADLDIVNPYFRTSDSKKELESKGIRVIASKFAGSNVDLPSVSDEVYAISDNKDYKAIVDVGGDDRGAYALGRYTPSILEENNYDNVLVINMYRPLTRDINDMKEIIIEIENACGIKFTSIVNNSNLGQETTPQDVLSSYNYSEEISKLTNLKIKFTSVPDFIYDDLKDIKNDLFCLKLQTKIV